MLYIKRTNDLIIKEGVRDNSYRTTDANFPMIPSVRTTYKMGKLTVTQNNYKSKYYIIVINPRDWLQIGE